MRNLHLLAVTCLLVGGVLLLGPSFGFSSITADRGTSVSTAPDDSALIALNKSVQGELDHQSYTTVGTLENNVDTSLGVDYRLSADHDGVSLQFDGQTGNPIDSNTNIVSSGAEEIALQCDSPGQMDGPVTVTAEVIQASGDGITISDATMDFTVSCSGELPASGDIEFDSLNVTVTEKNNGKLDSITIEWEVDNPDQANYVQIDTTYTDPVQVDPTASPHNITSYSGNGKFPVDVTVDIDGGERCTLTFNEGGEKTRADC